MRVAARPITGDCYVTVHCLSVLLLSTILFGVSDWSMCASTDWEFWEAFRIQTFIEIVCSFNVCSVGGLKCCMY
jgi:hypothetical protein